MRAPSLGLATRHFIYACALMLAACGDDPVSPALRQGDALAVHIEIPSDAGEGLAFAAEDLAIAFGRVAGLETSADVIRQSRRGLAVRVFTDADDLETQAYRIHQEGASLRVEAASDQGAAYGLYALCEQLGVEYFHPEETFFPAGDAAAEMPRGPNDAGFDGTVQSPRFARRGFHEHTQHPIVASDFFLRPGDADRRAMASNYLRWLFRNRQNVSSFHMLRTVDLDSWVPYMQEINAEADTFFIESGLVIGFVDEQQNAFKLFRPESDDRPAETQIPDRIDQLLAANFDFLTFQIGASEFTKPADDELLGYLSLTLDYIQANHSEVEMGTWIHITCDLEADDGSNFFHLPARADEAIRAWVHTTMFYTLEHPAPVYECENFHHQRDFYTLIEDQDRDREFYPETAWWLGFDNNVPLELPIYGWSRAWDIQQELDERTTGHVTFTSGREWGYWRYDHYLTKVTWDASLGWETYLENITPLFVGGQSVTDAIEAFTDLQVRHFYEENPELFFYLSGELPQDEVGAQVGVVARRPKRSYREILDLDDAAFATWMDEDLGALRRMRGEYAAAIVDLQDATEILGLTQPLIDLSSDALRAKLHQEAVDALRLFVDRFDQAIALYEGVAALRPWWVSSRTAMPDESLREPARMAAMEALDRARAVTTTARGRINAGGDRYRYPLSLLTRAKPESPTIYPFGYLEQTATAFFWTRRNQQLASLITIALDASDEDWMEPAPEAVFVAPKEQMTVRVPSDPLVSAVIGGLLPDLLLGLDAAASPGDLVIRLAQDTGGNERPDEGTEQALDGTLSAMNEWTGTPTSYPIFLRGEDGEVLATLTIADLIMTVQFQPAGEGLTAESGSLEGGLLSAEIIAAIGAVTGTDPEAASNLIKQVYDLEPDAPLPEQLPFAVDFEARPASF